MHDIVAVNRRGLLKGGAGVTAAAGFMPLFTALQTSAAQAAQNAVGEQTDFVTSPYGPVAPVNDLATGLPLLQLPKGFSYRSLGWTGDMMADGQPTPAWHDGMAVVTTGRGRTGADVLIRNHEYRANGAKFFVKDAGGNTVAAASYDKGASAVGGCTLLRVQNGKLLESRAAIAETDVNCAGGSTLWGTWLTCEETVAGPDVGSVGYEKTHGWVFEVSPVAGQTVATPITDMGRRSHEAAAFDPRTGDVYLTEDARNIALLYRFVPNNTSRRYGALAEGGALYAAKVVGIDKANLMALNGPRATHVNSVGQSFEIEWVRITNPGLMPQRYTENELNNPAPIVPSATSLTAPNVSGTFAQGRDAGALRMSRGEGCWWSNAEDCLFYADTNFGYDSSVRAGRGSGAMWRLTPNRSNPSRATLTLIFAPTAAVVGNAIDNVTVSPRGGLMAFEDGAAKVDAFGAGNRMLGFGADGQAYIFGKNNVNLTPEQVVAMNRDPAVHAGDSRDNEFAGGCFNSSGRTLYVNIQTPGITFAITGPWARGNL